LVQQHPVLHHTVITSAPVDRKRQPYLSGYSDKVAAQVVAEIARPGTEQ
jgi:hypothetical protein